LPGSVSIRPAISRSSKTDITAAAEQAARLADGYDALAGPSWVAWGHFESGATKALYRKFFGEPDENTLAFFRLRTIGE